MQGITERTLQPTAIHAVIALQVANGGLHRYSPFEPSLLRLGQILAFAPVNDFPVRVVGVHPAKTQIDHDVFKRDCKVLRQISRLLQNRAQDVAVVGVAREGARTQHQAMLVGDHHRALDPELVGLACFPLADAFNLRRVQGKRLGATTLISTRY